jgi:GNAT superfamily N-acetyltransferase
MAVHLIDSHDDAAFDAWYEVLRVTDLERWPDNPGWDHRTVKAMADLEGGATEFLCLAATDQSGTTVGIALLQVPTRENLHQLTVDVRVLPAHRRRHIGSALVHETERWAAAAGRRVLHAEVEVPLRTGADDTSTPFARKLGFEAVMPAHTRHLLLPADPERISRLHQEVARASSGYRTSVFTAPWPEAYVEDGCQLQRRMSTDAPSGDVDHQEEIWDAARVKEADDLAVAQGLTRLIAVAEHIASGHLVAFSEIAIPEARPTEGWQWATLVLREHRGHRLGLAVKLANLAYLETTFPSVRRIVTGNAQENKPMIAVNEMMGFEVAATETLWQKVVGRPRPA